jgi:tetratricopeptide (TPR) repeat protein
VLLPARAPAQQPDPIEEVVSILHEASTLVPKIEARQQPSVAANIARQQTRAGDLAGALATAQMLAKPSDRELAINGIAFVLTAKGNAPMALDLIRITAPEGYDASGYLWTATELAEKGDLESALSAARLIKKDPKQLSTFVDTLMRLYRIEWKTSDETEAAKILDEALKTVEHEQKNRTLANVRIAEMYVDIVGTMASAGNREGARSFVDRIRDLADEERHPEEKSMLLRDLAVAQADIGDFSAARDIGEGLQPGNSRDSVFEIIAMQQSAQGDPHGALDVVAKISYEPWRFACLRTIADALAESGNYTEALLTVKSIPAGKNRAYALAELALEQAKKNDRTASLTADLAWEEALSAKKEMDPGVFQFIAVTRGYLGDFQNAIDIISSLDAKSKPWPLWNLTEMMLEAGQKEQALTLAEMQDTPHARAYALLGIAAHELEEIDHPKNPALGLP